MTVHEITVPTLLATTAQHDELPLDSIVTRWTGPAVRLAFVLDDLVATGDLVEKGQGAKKVFVRTIGAR